jgi:hypothetical protein
MHRHRANWVKSCLMTHPLYSDHSSKFSLLCTGLPADHRSQQSILGTFTGLVGRSVQGTTVHGMIGVSSFFFCTASIALNFLQWTGLPADPSITASILGTFTVAPDWWGGWYKAPLHMA